MKSLIKTHFKNCILNLCIQQFVPYNFNLLTFLMEKILYLIFFIIFIIKIKYW